MSYVHQRRSVDPAGLTTAVAINGGVIAALLLAAPDVIPKRPGPFEPITIVTPIPPDPVKQRPPKTQNDRQSAPRPVEPVVVTDRSSETEQTVIADPGPIEPSTGDWPGATVDPPRPREPVLTGSRIDPRYAAALQPDYPPAMQRQGIEGVAIVRVLIGIDGRVKAVELVRADDPAFFTATRRQALSRWRFVPASRDGIAIESWREMTVRFEIGSKNA